MRREIVLGLWVVMLLLCSCQRGDKDMIESTTDLADSGKKQLIIYQYKLEILASLRALADAYETSHPDVEIILKNSGGTDYYEVIKGEFAAGHSVDIFNISSRDQLLIWSPVLEDLSEESWVPYLKEGTGDRLTLDGELYGMPYAIEGYGFIYNKKLLAEAGISDLPSTYTDFVTMVEKLNAHGIRPFFNDYQAWWVLSQHSFNMVLAGQEDPEGFIRGLRNGTVDLVGNETMNQWLDLIELTIEYGQDHPFMYGYNDSVLAFSKGEAAMIFQGNWVQDKLDELTPGMEIGLMPVPLNERLSGKLPIGIPSYWCVNAESEVKEIAKDFLDFMATSEAGQENMVKGFRFIPPFNHIEYDCDELGPLSAEVESFRAAGDYYDWYWVGLPNGTINEIHDYFVQYFSGELERVTLLENIEAVIYDLAN